MSDVPVEGVQCSLCQQTFGTQDQDAPRDIQVPCTVTCAKPGQPGGTCLRCSYVHRGSFKGITLTVLQQQMREYPQLKDKFMSLRASHVQILARNPKSKMRHEKVDLELFTRKKEESYIDLKEEMVWWSISSYFKEHAPPEAQKRCKNIAQKKKYVCDVLKMPLQFDESGNEGVAVKVRPEGQKLLVVGKRFSAESLKQQSHDSKEDQAEAFEKQQKGMAVAGVDQAAMEDALRKAAEDEEKGSDSDSSSSSSSSSSDSGFGLKKSKAKAKAKSKGTKGKKAQEPEKQDDAGQSHPPEPGSAPSASTRDMVSDMAASDKSGAPPSVCSEKQLPAAVLLDKAEACKKSLDQVTPWALYNGMKQKDIDARITKSLDMASKLEARGPDPTLSAAADQLNQVVNKVSQDAELFASLSSPKDLVHTLLSKAEEIRVILASWTHEQLGTFLNDLARKLCDLLIASSPHQPAFFKFLTVKKLDDWDGFSLRAVKSMEKDGLDYSQQVAQVQQNGLNYFMDRLRGITVAEQVLPILKAIPSAWYMPEICRSPIPASAPLTWDCVDASLGNDTGVVTKPLVDLQRFMACALAGADRPLDNSTKAGFKIISGSSSVSARVTLVIKSSLPIRNLWSKVVETGKQALDAKAALLKASDLTGAVTALEKAIVQGDDPRPTLWKWAAVTPVSDVLNLLEVENASLTDEQSALITSLRDAGESILQQGPALSGAEEKMAAYIKNQWLETSAMNNFFLLTTHSADEEVVKQGRNMLASCITAGMMSLHIAKDGSAPVASMISELGHAFLDFLDADSLKEEKVIQSLGLWRRLFTKMEAVKALPESEQGKHPVIEAVMDAWRRLEEQIGKGSLQLCKRIVQERGMVQGSLEVGRTFPCGSWPPNPDYVVQIVDSIAACSFMADESLDPESIKAEHDSLQSALPRCVKLLGLEKKVLVEVAPSEFEKIQLWTAAFEEKLLSWLRQKRSYMDKAFTDFEKFRCVLPALESWEIDQVAWIFKASEDETKVVEQEMDALLGYREACATFLPLLKALSGCMGALSVHGEAWGGHLLPDLLADVEEYRKLSAKTASAMAVAPMVINPADYVHDQKGYVAKSMQFAASVGISRGDLPQILIQKLDNWIATTDPDLSPHAAKAAIEEKKKRSGEDSQVKPAKKSRQAPAEKKRKK